LARPATTRFAVSAENNTRVLLSVREKNSGRLIVTTPGSGNLLRDPGIPGRDYPGYSPSHGVRIAHQKFSIHPSQLSQAHNQLHFSQILANGEKQDGYHVTQAIEDKKFAPLFIKRLSALRDPVYFLKKATNAVRLDTFDVNAFSMIIFVLIGPSGSKFLVRGVDFDVHQTHFRLFSIVLLWSYFILPSNDFSYIGGFLTIDPTIADNEHEKEMLESLMQGVEPQKGVEMYSTLRDLLREEALLTASRWVPDLFHTSSEAVFKLARLRYFRTGKYNNKVLRAIHKKYPNGV
jgi:hypothetical protein